MMKKVGISMFCAGALALAACKDKSPATVEKATGPATAVPTNAPSSAPAGHEGHAHAVAPASQPAAQQAPAAEAFGGTLKLDASLGADAVKPTDVLFIMARQSMSGAPGPLVATVRHAPVTLPLAYTLGPQNLMMQGATFSGPFIVNARLDRDGDPMTKGADDLYATFEKPVNGGEKDVDLILKKGP